MNANYKTVQNKYADVLVGPHQLALDITNKCNLRCLHCYNSSGDNAVINDELTDEELLKLAEDIVDMQIYNVCFCGGEPLLRYDIILKMLDIFSEHRINTSLVTNSLCINNSNTVQKLSNHGLRAFQVSLDGSCACSHDRLRNKHGVFAHAINVLKEAIRIPNLQISVAFTPTNFNIEEFTDLYFLLDSMVEEANIKRSGYYVELRSQPLMLLGRANENTNINPSPKEYRKLVRTIKELKQRPQSKFVRVDWGDPVDHLMRFSQDGMLLDQASIRANGDLIVSNYIPLIIGNIRKHKFSKYWQNGLPHLWHSPVFKYFSDQIMSIADMNRMDSEIATIYKEGEYRMDLFECSFDDVSYLKLPK